MLDLSDLYFNAYLASWNSQGDDSVTSFMRAVLVEW